MKNIFTWIGLALVVIGAAVGAFTGIEAAKWIELAACSVGLAVCVVSIVNGSERKDWKVYVALAGIAVGTVLLIWGGMAENTITTIISAVIGLAALIAGLIPVITARKKE
ncbi:MAG TPA: hypothetical protein DCZ74_03185 [Treponema sp.]|nr:hypothetical protein [Treponema sp.]